MKNQNFIATYFRPLANALAANANGIFQNAKTTFRQFNWYANKLKKTDEFLLNSPWRLFSLIYFGLLTIDGFIMKPIIALVVQHGFQLDGDIMIFVFVFIYLILVMGLTIGVAHGLARFVDAKLRDLHIELDAITTKGKARFVIEQEVRGREGGAAIIGVVFATMLIALLISLSLYRNYVVNDFMISFDSPDDWVNIILPLALGLALCFFGIYKDVLFRRLWMKSNMNSTNKELGRLKQRYLNMAKQTIEQEEEALNALETSPISADLQLVLERHNNNSISDDNFFDELHWVQVELSVNNKPIPGIQVLGITGDAETIYTMSDEGGTAMIEWTTDSDMIRTIRIGSVDLKGNRWMHGSTIKLDLAEIAASAVNPEAASHYFQQRFGTGQGEGPFPPAA